MNKIAVSLLNTLGWLATFFIFNVLFACTVFACVVIDDVGNTIIINNPAERIISLAPDVTETLFAIGAGDRLVGVVSGSDYPGGVKKIPRVGSYSAIDLEKIISLHPDLIVTWSNMFSPQISVLKKMGVSVYVTRPHQLEDIPRAMRNLGCLVGTKKKADEAARNFLLQLKYLQLRYQTQKSVTVFYQIDTSSLMTISKESWINQVIELCGGRNIFSNAITISPEVSWESVVMINPQVIISGTENENWKTRWQRWPTMSAVKENKLFHIHPDLIERAGPRLLKGATQLCEYLESARKMKIN